ncbi:rhomboid-like protein [Streptomyces sp. NPDC015220]|uniref:rhomboid-like protein n=1 Tax=Streptomyces sp. NPDC015220 TaxID=3364947 RepID=UPI00370298C5
MERTATDDAAASSRLDGVPRQRPVPPPAGRAVPGASTCEAADAATCGLAASGAAVGATGAARPGRPLPWRLLPTPAATPFTLAYAAVLAVTSLVARYAAPSVVDALHRGSSTDVAHLVRAPLLVLPASALWIAGGLVTPYSLCFLLVLTALERRIGGLRTAGVFLYGHVLATLATEVPVGLAVAAGALPGSSLHRLDYGISFGVAASLGALAGLLRPWLRWPVLVLFAGVTLADLLTFADPLASSGHLVSVGLGVASWPVVRRWHRALGRSPADGRRTPLASRFRCVER